LNFADERYVRLYTRDTPTWLALSFDGQAVMCLLLRKVDRAGVVDLGTRGRDAIPLLFGHRAEKARILAALGELEAEGVVVIEGDRLLMPKFMEAQEVRQSDAQRKREERARNRELGRDVTKRDGGSQNVTESHQPSQEVTPTSAVPSVPSVPSKEEEEERPVAADAAPPPPVPQKQKQPKGSERIEKLREVYNANRGGLPEWRSPISPKRAKLVLAALDWQPDLEWWAVVFGFSGQDDFRLGKLNKRGGGFEHWRADAAWLLDPEHAAKAYEDAESSGWTEKQRKRRALAESRKAGVLRCLKLGDGEVSEEELISRLRLDESRETRGELKDVLLLLGLAENPASNGSSFERTWKGATLLPAGPGPNQLATNGSGTHAEAAQ
jgi:hypothetical protein